MQTSVIDGGVAYWLDCRPRSVNFPYPALDWRLAMWPHCG